MSNTVYVSEIKIMMERINKINSIKLKDLVLLDEEGEQIKITEDMIENLKFTGLSIKDFIYYGYYKEE